MRNCSLVVTNYSTKCSLSMLFYLGEWQINYGLKRKDN